MSEYIRIESKLTNNFFANNRAILQQIANNFPELYKRVRDVDFNRLVEEIMQRALKVLAGDNRQYAFQTYIKDAHGNALTSHQGRPFIGVIRTPSVSLGLGVTVDQRGLTFVTESTGTNPRSVQELKEQIENCYVAVANIEVQKLLGYSVDVRVQPGNDNDKSVVVVNAEKVV